MKKKSFLHKAYAAIILFVAVATVSFLQPAIAQDIGSADGPIFSSGCDIASSSTLGCVEGDGSSVSINGSGVLSVATGGVTNAMLAGSIANAKLANSAITIGNAGSTALGGSASMDSILGDTTNGIVKRTSANTYAAAVAGTDYAAANASFTLGSTSISLGGTTTSVSGLTLSGGTLSGTTTLADGGSLTSSLNTFDAAIKAGGPVTITYSGASDPPLLISTSQIGAGFTVNGVSGTPAAQYRGMTIQSAGTEESYIGSDGTDSTNDIIFRFSASTNAIRIVNSGAVANTIYVASGGVGIGTTTTNGSGTLNVLNSISAGTQITVDGATAEGAGTVNALTGYYVNNTQGLASKTCTISALGATITITGGIVTATSGC